MNLKNSILSGAVMVACGMGTSASVLASSSDALTVAVYGGVGERAITKCVLAPFTKETGIKVITDPGSSSVTMTKLSQQTKAPVIDVAWMDGGPSELAWTAGLVEPLDPARLPNLKNLIPQARYEQNGNVYAAGTGYYAMGLLYNKEMVKTAPSSWKDLWNDEYRDLIALPSPANAMGLPILVHLAGIYGGDIDNVQPAIDQLKKLEVAAFWDSSGTATNMFQSEEIAISPHFSTSAWTLINAGQPLAYVVPKEGAVGNDIRVHLVKNTPRREAAEKLINAIFTAETAECLAGAFNAGPYVEGVTLSPEIAKTMPWGADGTIDNLVIPDWLALNAKREALTQAWNANLSRR